MNLINSIDIFCAVVDNFGDIGVCWRFARQLSVERGKTVRLFVDDIEAAKAILPENLMGVEVLHWTADVPYSEGAEMVVEAFACSLPDHVIAAMVAKKSIWIDLEYLSAEDWVGGCHAIPSKHPSTGLIKTLFFPGFDGQTGGIIRENDLISRRDAFFGDKNAQNQWREAHLIPKIDRKYIDISFFYYKTAPFEAFLNEMGGLGRPVRVFKPVRGTPLPPIIIGNLEIHEIPFISQYHYDYLLWTCDFNFVRGEDSFVRAQLAGKPYVWNIYVQEENAHLIKLQAFLDKIKPFYDAESFERLAHLHDLWNEGGQIPINRGGEIWRQCFQSLTGLEAGARRWTDYLVTQTDLATQLLAFAEKLKTKE